MVTNCLGSELLDCNEYPNAVSNLLDAHLFEYELITLDEITAGDIVD